MGCGGVDPIRQTPELHTLLVKFPNQVNQPFDRATESIELPHDQEIARTQV